MDAPKFGPDGSAEAPVLGNQAVAWFGTLGYRWLELNRGALPLALPHQHVQNLAKAPDVRPCPVFDYWAASDDWRLRRTPDNVPAHDAIPEGEA